MASPHDPPESERHDPWLDDVRAFHPPPEVDDKLHRALKEPSSDRTPASALARLWPGRLKRRRA